MLRKTALARGYADDEIARLRRHGQWTALQRGAYTVGEGTLSRRDRHVLAVHATVAALPRPAVVSHASAAALHGLPLWGLSLDRVEITRHPPARSDLGTRLRSRVARLPAADVVPVGDLVVTSVARTVVDIARAAPFQPALVVADAALRAELVTSAELAGCVDEQAGIPGARRARRVVTEADGRSGSVGESRSRAVMLTMGLPMPDLQVEVHTPGGRFIGRCDFGWRQAGLLGEFDGRIKYGRLLRPGQEPGDAVFEEKQREDALRDEGWGMVRWIWRELDTPAVLARRIERRLSAPRR